MTTRRAKMVATRCECNRCHHVWTALGELQASARCPRCKSRYWNLPRVRKRKAAPAA